MAWHMAWQVFKTRLVFALLLPPDVNAQVGWEIARACGGHTDKKGRRNHCKMLLYDSLTTWT